MLKFISCALGSKCKIEQINEEELIKIYRLSKKHDLAHLVAKGLENAKMFPAGEIGDRYGKAMMTAMFRYERSRAELDRIREVFEENKVRFMPLKGAVIRNMYPEPWLRSSCDIDIFVERDVCVSAAELLSEKLGYDIERTASHDIQIYSKDRFVHVELHFDLIESSVMPSASEVLKTVAERSVPVREGSYEMKMSPEIFYFYHIAHTAKHVKHGGCGVRPFIDIFIMDKSGEFEIERCDALLKTGGLYPFAEKARLLAEKWFSGKEPDDEGVFLLEEYILGAGVYGSSENRMAVGIGKKRAGKIKYLLRRIFMPYEDLCNKYPSLKGRRLLTPIYQIRRIFGFLVNGRFSRGVKELKKSSSITDEKLSSVDRMFKILGLEDQVQKS